MQNIIHRTLAVSILSLVALGTFTVSAEAKGNDSEVRVAGNCSGQTDWRLKAKPDDGRLEVELEIDSNRVGQTWTLTMADNGTQVFAGSRVTAGPSGSFEVERNITNRAGTDIITATARHGAELCQARLVFPR